MFCRNVGTLLAAHHLPQPGPGPADPGQQPSWRTPQLRFARFSEEPPKPQRNDRPRADRPDELRARWVPVADAEEAPQPARASHRGRRRAWAAESHRVRQLAEALQLLALQRAERRPGAHSSSPGDPRARVRPGVSVAPAMASGRTAPALHSLASRSGRPTCSSGAGRQPVVSAPARPQDLRLDAGLLLPRLPVSLRDPLALARPALRRAVAPRHSSPAVGVDDRSVVAGRPRFRRPAGEAQRGGAEGLRRPRRRRAALPLRHSTRAAAPWGPRSGSLPLSGFGPSAGAAWAL